MAGAVGEVLKFESAKVLNRTSNIEREEAEFVRCLTNQQAQYESPSITPSMRSAVDTLRLQELWVVYPGVESFSLTEQITCHSLASVLEQLQRL